jgi:hypothetical protein
MKKIKAGMDVLRDFFLGRHKRRMTQSFLGWLHSQPKYKPCGIGMSLVVKLSHAVNSQDAVAGLVYSWTGLGRAIYVDWQQDWFKSVRKNVLAGRDALERLSNTSWWDWEDGSGQSGGWRIFEMASWSGFVQLQNNGDDHNLQERWRLKMRQWSRKLGRFRTGGT